VADTFGARIGIFGGGQLGRMLGLSARALGLVPVFVEPSSESPAADVGELVQRDYSDGDALARLSSCDVVTYEFENVPAAAVRALAGSVRVFPGADALDVAQDRFHEKSCFQRLGIETPRFAPIGSAAELEAAFEQIGLPAVLKTRRFGYDGKGQVVLRHASEVRSAVESLAPHPLILEQFVPFERELSVIAVRSSHGEIARYPLVENRHSDGILRLTLAPAARVSAELDALASAYVQRIMLELDYVGVLALELFQVGERLLANEMAPRVHNSGHWTIEGAVTSQFENHLRAILGLPLGVTQARGPCAMLNLVGSVPEAPRILAVPGAHLHWYGKSARPGRKLGHVTLSAPDSELLAQRLRQLEALVQFVR
jgi:5-(carboxyamino)imidazole ribonucleotide synthase